MGILPEEDAIRGAEIRALAAVREPPGSSAKEPIEESGKCENIWNWPGWKKRLITEWQKQINK